MLTSGRLKNQKFQTWKPSDPPSLRIGSAGMLLTCKVMGGAVHNLCTIGETCIKLLQFSLYVRPNTINC